MQKHKEHGAKDRKRILVVDDDTNFRQIIGRTLELEGYDVTTAADGNKALTMLSSLKPHLIILDIMMPEINGYEVLLRIRKKFDVPVLMLSAIGAVDSLEKSVELGADGYVTKPFQIEELLARIRALLRRAKR